VAGYEPREEPLFTSSALGEIYRYTRGFPRLINIVCDNVLLTAYSDDINQVSAGLVKKVVGGMEKTYARHVPYIPGQNMSKGRGMSGLWIGLTAAAAFLIFISALVVVLLSPLGQNIMDKSRDMLGISQETSSLSHIAQGTIYPLNMKKSEGAALQGLPKVSIQDQAGEAAVVPPVMGEQKQTTGVTIAVGPGDTVAKLAARHYGRVDSVILDIVRKANSNLENIDLIYEGQKINLPTITDTARVMFTVSVASYHSINEATAVFIDLVKKGFKAAIYPHLDTQGNTWYRVTIGTFNEQNKADMYARQLKTQGFLYAKSVKVSVEG
jgi:phage tail protein X